MSAGEERNEYQTWSTGGIFDRGYPNDRFAGPYNSDGSISTISIIQTGSYGDVGYLVV